MTIQSFNAWTAAAAGFKYLPYSLMAQAVTITGAIAIGQVTWDTVKEALFPSNSQVCDAVYNSTLLQKVLRLGAMNYIGLNDAAGEEVIVRGILQDGLLTRVPKAVLGIFGRNHWVDSRPAQVVRGGISAVVFAAMHLANSMILSPEQMRVQIANTLGFGIIAAAVKERTGSVLAAMGLHALYNAIFASIPSLWLITNACSIFKSDQNQMPFSSSPSSPPSSSSPSLTNRFLDQNASPVESNFRYPICSSENNVLAKKAKFYMGYYYKKKQERCNEKDEFLKKVREAYCKKQQERYEKAESLLQLAQSPYPVEDQDPE